MGNAHEMSCETRATPLERRATKRDIALEPEAKITSIVCPTRTRIEILKRALTSYILNCEKYGRATEFVIGDDSPRAETRTAYRQMLTELRQKYNARIAYVGLEEKLRYARTLIDRGKLDP